jgi:hypothetical protein
MNDLCSSWIELSDREAVGDALSEQEQAFMRGHAASCPACGAEQATWCALGTLLAREQPVVEVTAPAALARGPERTRRWSGFALSAACAVALATAGFGLARPGWFNSGAQRSGASAAATVPNTAHAWTVRVAAKSGVEVDGQVLAQGASIAIGALISARGNIACLSVDPGVRACLARNSRVRVVELSEARRRLELLSGRIVSELPPQPAGSSFGVLTRAGSVVAVGTAFSVEIPEDGSSIVTRVSHGTVLVSTARGERRVQAHHMAFMDGRVAALTAGDELHDWALLDAREPSALPTQTSAAPALDHAPTQPDEKHTHTQAPRSSPALHARELPGSSASVLLHAARMQRVHGDAQRAIDAYRVLLARHPRTREAQVGRVAYGELLLSRGETRAALELFEQYLEQGGPLAEEASYHRLKALAALAQRDAERAGIQAFLRTFPESPRAAALAARLSVLVAL